MDICPSSTNREPLPGDNVCVHYPKDIRSTPPRSKSILGGYYPKRIWEILPKELLGDITKEYWRIYPNVIWKRWGDYLLQRRHYMKILGDTTQRDIKEILGDTAQIDIKEILGDTAQRDIEKILGDTTQRDIKEILGDTTQIDMYLGNNISG
ncbi:hypothetical protein Tco_0097753 [Tanacetum coccineum]